jgi:hypothetical protein
MTPGEWATFCARLEMAFRGGLEDDREAELHRHFGRVTFEDATNCLNALVHAGQVFMPAPGELIAVLRTVRAKWVPIHLVLQGLDDDQALDALNARAATQIEAAAARRANQITEKIA